MTRKNGKNQAAADYWRGYREAYEDVLFFGLEHVKKEGFSSHDSEDFEKGYASRIAKLSAELAKLMKVGNHG